MRSQETYWKGQVALEWIGAGGNGRDACLLCSAGKLHNP